MVGTEGVADPACTECGARVATSAGGRVIHIEAIPDGKDPYHPVTGVTAHANIVMARHRKFDLKAAAEDMLAHHATTHPSGECEWSRRLEQALRGA